MERIKTLTEQEKTDRLIDRGMRFLGLILYYLSSFTLSGAGLFSVRVPFSIGFSAVCRGAELIASCLGSITGCFFRMDKTASLGCLIPLAGTVGTVLAIEKLGIRYKKIPVLSASVFLFTFASSTVLMFAATPTLNAFMLNLCSSLLCAGSVAFYSGTVECIHNKRNVYLLDSHSFICIMMSLCTLLLGSSEISIFGFRPARFFGSFVIITAAFLFSQAGGSIAGTSIGTCVAVSGTSIALSLCYGISGLAAGVFSKYGQLVTALVFSGIAGVFALIDGTPEGVSVFAEAAVASLVFTAIPKKYLTKIRSEIAMPKARKTASEFSGAKERILNASKAIGSVSKCVESVSRGIEALAPANDVIVGLRVKERVCADCKLKGSLCPEKGEFSAIIKKLSQGESVSAEDFSADFNVRCPSVPRLADSFNRIYASRSAVNALQASATRNREIACGQFDKMAELLKELSVSVETDAASLHMKERTALRVLSEMDFNVISVACTQPFSGSLRLRCTVEEIPQATSLTRLTAAISSEIGAEMNPPKIKECADGKELIFRRKEILGFRFGSACASCGDRRLCGDYFECFRTESKAYVIMSDGMGTGGRAAIDSAMTVELFSRMIRAGISPETALGITNTALAVKSDDESLSTLDVAEIDLFSGETLILKAGAAPSFYTNSGRVGAIEPPSTPLGILNNIGFSRYSLKLRGGDMLVMVSDGILGCGSGWLKDEIKAARNPDPREFSKLLLDTARRKCGGNFDDMTVVTLIMEEK